MHQVEITERINDYFADSTIVGVGFEVAGLDSFCEEFVFSSASPSAGAILGECLSPFS